MHVLRTILKAIGVVAAPFIVFVVVLLIVHALSYDGVGPDDGAMMTAMIVAFPVAICLAVPLWGVSLIWLFARVFDPRHRNFVNDENDF